MAAPLEVSCPSCGKALKVPAELAGKRVKCKGCLEVFLVRAPKVKPAAAAGPKPKAAEASGAKPAPPDPATAKSNAKVTWDDEADNDNAAHGVIHEEDIARCPHCAKELDPPDAVVCIHCGFNNRTRTRAETRKVWAPTQADYVAHLGPAVAAVVFAIVVIVGDFIATFHMKEWLTGGPLEKEGEKDLNGDPVFWVSPGLFVMLLWAASVGVFVPLLRYAYERLVNNSRPPEAKMGK